MEGNLRFKIDWASLKVGSKFTVLTLFYFVFEGNFPSTSHRGAYIWRGDLTEGFLRYRFRGLIFGGSYKWRGLFSEFYSICFFFFSMERSLFHEFSQQSSDTCTICCSFVLGKGEKEPFDFNSSSYGYFSMALSYFLELFSRLVYRLT